MASILLVSSEQILANSVRRPVSQTAVWPLSVVFLSPSFDLPPRISQIHEPVRVQAFVSEASVEALNMAVLHRLSRVEYERR